MTPRERAGLYLDIRAKCGNAVTIALRAAGRIGCAGQPCPVMSSTSAARPARIAIVDRDTGFLQVLANRLQSVGWEHRVLAAPVPPDELVAMRIGAVVIDLAVLGPQAWSYLETLCTRLPSLGVVVCTGQSSWSQRVRGLRLGADDWVTKPCHPEELIARTESVVRRRTRVGSRADRPTTRTGELEIRPDRFQAFVGGASIHLTRREFELIDVLAQAEGQVMERAQIYEQVWGYAMVHGDRSVDVFVRKLRHKLERASPGWRYIHTHFAIGYRLGPQQTDASPDVHPATTPAGAVPAPREPALVGVCRGERAGKR